MHQVAWSRLLPHQVLRVLEASLKAHCKLDCRPIASLSQPHRKPTANWIAIQLQPHCQPRVQTHCNIWLCTFCIILWSLRFFAFDRLPLPNYSLPQCSRVCSSPEHWDRKLQPAIVVRNVLWESVLWQEGIVTEAYCSQTVHCKANCKSES